MPGPWLPTDARQRAILRRLKLVGGEQTAFFLDACRIMDGEVGLAATTHVVGHLLREIDSGIAQAIRPFGSEPTPSSQSGEDSHRKKIDALCESLCIDDSAFATYWHDYATKLSKWAHNHARAGPRPIDQSFRDVWNTAQTVLDRVTSRIEAKYIRGLAVADALAAGPPNVTAFRQRIPVNAKLPRTSCRSRNDDRQAHIRPCRPHRPRARR